MTPDEIIEALKHLDTEGQKQVFQTLQNILNAKGELPPKAGLAVLGISR